ncbi:MAG TPA: hypothetical protein VGG57_16240 [Stellaceae bacterium]|jgi:hypothetical protein
MARSALTQLQDQIEAIRKEAYAEGYAAAMQVIQRAVAGGATGVAPPRRRGGAEKPGAAAAAKPTAEPAKPARTAKAPARRRTAKAAAPRAASSRPRRGNNAAMIEEILKEIAPRAARPAEIRTALQRDKGAAVAFTSIRHALGQLSAREVIEEVGDSKTWRIKG